MTTARHDIDPRYQEPRRRRSHTLGETAVAGHVAGALVASGVGGVRRDGIPLLPHTTSHHRNERERKKRKSRAWARGAQERARCTARSTATRVDPGCRQRG